jgi:hypothetical protein
MPRSGTWGRRQYGGMTSSVPVDLMICRVAAESRLLRGFCAVNVVAAARTLPQIRVPALRWGADLIPCSAREFDSAQGSWGDGRVIQAGYEG